MANIGLKMLSEGGWAALETRGHGHLHSLLLVVLAWLYFFCPRKLAFSLGC